MAAFQLTLKNNQVLPPAQKQHLNNIVVSLFHAGDRPTVGLAGLLDDRSVSRDKRGTL
jgi:hypothetical protein